MSFITNFASGYRTYIVAVVLVLGVITEKVLGIDVPGFEVGSDWMTVVLGALGLGTLRAGISNTAK